MIRTRGCSLVLTIATGLLVGLSAGAARAADTVVQVPLPGLLDARSVTTLTAGKLVTWTLPTDGGGLQNAFATAAVAMAQNAPVANALPDDGHFVADARHPDVVLHFSNDADAASPQTHLVMPSASFNFAMPPATYSKLFLFFNGAANGTTIKVTFTYTDGMDTQNATIPDYYADVSPTDPVIFDLATNLAKWDKSTKIAEANHHNITGAELHPTAGKTLTQVQVERGANGYLVFWGATGVATSAVAGSGGASGAAGASGASGSGGASAMGGVSGGAGAAGAVGTAGTGGAGGMISAGGETSAGSGGTISSGTAGATAAAGALTSPGGAQAIAQPAASDSGCGCRLGSSRDAAPGTAWLALGVLGACLARTRKRCYER
jgi:hypothetical protein